VNNRASGDLGEDIATRYLARRGYEVVERNYRTRRGEIDLVARLGDTLVFVEVKLRRGTAYGDPLEAVTPRKQRAIRLMAEEYLAERDPDYEDLRFDVVGILLPAGGPEISHVEGAF
jgi:putative endonuclease